MTETVYNIKIARRPWYEWLAWLVWLLAVAFTFQNARASAAELESTAVAIFWAVFAVLIVGGAIVYYVRRQRLSA